MEFTYENQGASTYLVYEVKESDVVDSLSLGMLTNNKIQGLAQTLFTQMNETRYIKYNVSSKISVRQFFNGPVNKKRLLGVFSGIVDGLLSAEDYMIDSNAIVLDLDYIFADVSTCEAMLICLPISNLERERTDLGVFFKNIMVNTQFDSTENSDHVAKIFNFLNTSPVFSLTDFKMLLEEIRNDGNVTDMLSNVKNESINNQQNTAQNNINNRSVQPQQIPVQQAQPIPVQQQQRTIQVQSKPQSQQAQQFQQPVRPMPNNIQMNIPNGNMSNQSINGKQQQFQANQPSGTQKEMSLFYLLQHYSAENAAIYKAQKAAKKANAQNNMASGNMGMPEAGNKHKRDKNPKMPKGQPQSGNFNVPGKPEGNGMRVPSMQGGNVRPPMSGMNGQHNFAIPGQQNMSIVQNRVQQQNVTQPQQSVQNEYAATEEQIGNVRADYNNPSQNKAQEYNQSFVQPQQHNQEQPSMQGQQMNFGETTNLDMLRNGGTTVLNPSMRNPQMISPNLIRMKNNEKIMINKPVFRIGKEKSYVDYFVSDNTAVSRSHANIITRDSKYYVMDTNSTNHTYVNGKMIQSNIEVEIENGDKIRFGNEDFEFRMF